MNRYTNKLVLAFALMLGLFVGSSNAGEGVQTLMNEILVNPNGGDSNCEFVEIIGTPSGALTNIYFASIEGDGTSTVGAFDRVVDLSASTLGTNGLLVITNDAAGDCSRTYNTPTTTRVQVTNFSMENGTTSWSLIASPTTAIVEGTDYDSNDDGTLDALPADSTILDGIGWTDGGASDVTYGAFLGPTTFGAPDMATRFPGNMAASSAAAWYFGDMDGTNDSVMYDATQVSDNFPVGGMLTPGTANVGTAAVPGKANVDFNGDGMSDFVITRSPDAVGTTSQLTWYVNDNASGNNLGYAWGISTDRGVPSDYDGDGSDDIAVWRPNNGNGAAFYILNSADSTVTIDNFGLIGDDPKVVGDYDGDGADDVAVYRQNAGGQNFFYYRASSNNPNNDITFVPWGSGEFVRPNAGDYDGDGKHDYCIYNQSGQFVLLRSSDSAIEYVNWGIGTEALVPGDADNDGMDDFIIVRNDNNQRNWYILERDGGGTGASPIVFGLPSDALTAGDYDGDGNLDVSVWRPSEGNFYIQNSSDNSLRVMKWGSNGDSPEANWNVHQAGTN